MKWTLHDIPRCTALGLAPFIYALLLLLVGCSPSYQGKRLQPSAEILQEIENMSHDQAVETLKLCFQKNTEKYESVITSQEWEEMKAAMNSSPWLERQLTSANLDEPRRHWYEWRVTGIGIEYRTHHEDYSRWVEKREPAAGMSVRIWKKRQPVPPETTVTTYRYADVIELRTHTDSSGKAGLRLYCDVRAGSGSSFWLYPDEGEDLEPLTKALIRLCPNIKR